VWPILPDRDAFQLAVDNDRDEHLISQAIAF